MFRSAPTNGPRRPDFDCDPGGRRGPPAAAPSERSDQARRRWAGPAPVPLIDELDRTDEVLEAFCWMSTSR